MKSSEKRILPLLGRRGRFIEVLALLLVLAAFQLFRSDSGDVEPQTRQLDPSVSTEVIEPVKIESDPVYREEFSVAETDWQTASKGLLLIYPEIVKLHQITVQGSTPVEAISELQPMLYSSDPAVRLAALESVAELDSPQALPMMLNALNDRLPLVRKASIEGLSLRADSEIAGVIEPFLFDNDISVKMAAIDALAIVGGEQAVASLVGLLNDYDPVVRNCAVNALGEIDSAEISQYLFPLQYDPDGRVRNNVETILAEQLSVR